MRRFWLIFLLILTIPFYVEAATISSGGGHIIQKDGSPYTPRPDLNFTGAGVSIANPEGETYTQVDIGFSSIPASNYYVAPNGSNTDNTCIAQGTPCATIQYAINQIPALFSGSTTLHLASGSYYETAKFESYKPSGDYELVVKGYINSSANSFSNSAVATGTVATVFNTFPLSTRSGFVHSMAPITWGATSNATATPNANDIKRTGGATATSSSSQTITGAGTGKGISFTISPGSAVDLVGGLSNDNPGTTINSVDYAFYCWSGNNNMYIYENGADRGSTGTCSATSTYRVRLNSSGYPAYYVNNTLIYTSAIAPSYPLKMYTIIVTANASILDVRLSNTTTNTLLGAVNTQYGRFLRISGGTGYDSTNDENNWYVIDTNLDDYTLYIVGRWRTLPTTSTTYEIYDPLSMSTIDGQGTRLRGLEINRSGGIRVGRIRSTNHRVSGISVTDSAVDRDGFGQSMTKPDFWALAGDANTGTPPAQAGGAVGMTVSGSTVGIITASRFVSNKNQGLIVMGNSFVKLLTHSLFRATADDTGFLCFNGCYIYSLQDSLSQDNDHAVNGMGFDIEFGANIFNFSYNRAYSNLSIGILIANSGSVNQWGFNVFEGNGIGVSLMRGGYMSVAAGTLSDYKIIGSTTGISANFNSTCEKCGSFSYSGNTTNTSVANYSTISN